MTNVNDYRGLTDSEIIENALAALDTDRTLLIPPRAQENEPERDWWLIDRAILLDSDTTVVMRNSKIKLSDSARDNFFRSANCGFGFDDNELFTNIHIRGEGLCVLEGANHPRATGDGTKVLANPCPKTVEDLKKYADWIPEETRKTGKDWNFWYEHSHSLGTDAGKEGESQYGDWRGVGILFAMVDRFSIEGLRIVDSHGWGISCEACTNGRIEKIDFDATMARMIDGMLQNSENQDGIDLRNGCHDIVISDITGRTGDDIVALTAIARGDKIHPGGALRTTHVMHNDWSRRDRDIHDVIIRNVLGYSGGGICFHVRLLPVESKIYNIVIDGVVDSSPEGFTDGGAILLGEGDGGYGVNLSDGMKNITISNVISKSRNCIIVAGYLKDSVITNVVNRNPDCGPFSVHRENGMVNVLTSNIFSAEKED